MLQEKFTFIQYTLHQNGKMIKCLIKMKFQVKNIIIIITDVIIIKNCQILVKNLNFVAGMTQRFVSAKRLVRYFSNSSKLVEHRAQSPVREIKMLAVWPSIAEGFPIACSRIIYNKKLSNTCEEFKFLGWYDAAFRLGQETRQIQNNSLLLLSFQL